MLRLHASTTRLLFNDQQDSSLVQSLRCSMTTSAKVYRSYLNVISKIHAVRPLLQKSDPKTQSKDSNEDNSDNKN